MINDSDKKLILDVASKRISRDEFTARYFASHEKTETHLADLLEEIFVYKDAEALVYALMLECYIDEAEENRADILRRLAYVDWHNQHEEIMETLKYIGDPEDVDCIYHIAITHHDSLDYDDNENLTVQCTWALRKINTPEAKAKLELMAQSNNERVRNEAQTRLRTMK
jgi:hypothetical protein